MGRESVAGFDGAAIRSKLGVPPSGFRSGIGTAPTRPGSRVALVPDTFPTKKADCTWIRALVSWAAAVPVLYRGRHDGLLPSQGSARTGLWVAQPWNRGTHSQCNGQSQRNMCQLQSKSANPTYIHTSQRATHVPEPECQMATCRDGGALCHVSAKRRFYACKMTSGPLHKPFSRERSGERRIDYQARHTFGEKRSKLA